jgi:exopolysaccharide biosynthesis polyprenyl glycosylphosphotransferase
MGLKRRDLPNKYLLLLDLCSIILAYLLTSWLRYGDILYVLVRSENYRASMIFILSIYIVVYYLYSTYRGFFKRGFLEEMIIVAKLNIILAATITLLLFLLEIGGSYSRLFFICFILSNSCITYVLRQYFKFFLLAVYKRSSSCDKVMIITTSDQIKKVISKFRSENDWDYQVSCLTVLDQDMVGQQIEGIKVKANINNMLEIAKVEVIDEVFIHIPSEFPIELNLEETVLKFQNMGITVDVSINTLGLKTKEKVIRGMSGYHVLTFSSNLFNESQLILKRILDIIGGLVGCVLTIILTIFIAPMIRLETPGPIFFSQTRIGKNGRRFKIYKFRSMYVDAESRKQELMDQNEMNGLMFKMKNDPRVTRVGRFLRRTSLDEFPQFFNVLKGDMSLVGTRPPTESEFLQYESRHKRRLRLKSGVTGLWQVSGRSNITSFEEVVRMDLEYIDNWSLLMDIKILFKTLGVVLFSKGAN